MYKNICAQTLDAEIANLITGISQSSLKQILKSDFEQQRIDDRKQAVSDIIQSNVKTNNKRKIMKKEDYVKAA